MTIRDDAIRDFAEIRTAGGYRVILADPPWSYEAWSEKGEGKSAQAHYKCLSIDEICSFPAELLAARDCALFLWVTWPFMPEWNRVIEAWGFEYAGLAWEWIKFNPETGLYAFGGGHGTRKNLEPCLLATRGNPQLRKTARYFGIADIPEGVRSVRDFIEAMPLDAIRSRRREHSRKPEEQYDRIETLFDPPYVELFGRTRRPAWTTWGDEVGKFEEVA